MEWCKLKQLFAWNVLLDFLTDEPFSHAQEMSDDDIHKHMNEFGKTMESETPKKKRL